MVVPGESASHPDDLCPFRAGFSQPHLPGIAYSGSRPTLLQGQAFVAAVAGTLHARVSMVRALLALALMGCGIKSPSVEDPGAVTDAGQLFADVVLSYTVGGEPQACTEGIPPCDGAEAEPCGPTEVLGAPDDVTFELEAGGRLDLGFRCTSVVERGGASSPDVAIWATVPEDANAVVEVSEDGANYEPWDELTMSNQSLDLATIDRTYARFIRIADRGGGGILIDAVQALQMGDTVPTVDAGPGPDAAL